MASLAQKIGSVSANIETTTRAREFVALARCIALSKGGHRLAGEIAREARLGPTVQSVLDSPFSVHKFDMRLQKAAASAGTTNDAVWALPLANYDVLANAFMSSLQNYGAFDRLLPAARVVPMRVRVGAVTTAASGSAVGQGQSKPISRLTLASGTVDERKCVCVLTVTEELAQFSNPAAGNLFATELSNAVEVATDAEFISILSSGATSNGSSGATSEHFRNDLRAALAAITTSARSRLFLLVTPAIAKTLSVLHTSSGDAAFPAAQYNGGQVGGIEIVPSDAVTSGQMILVDAQQLALASEAILLDASDQASVQMDTAPDSPPTSATNMVSLWQMDMLGLKATRFFGATKLTSTGVCVVTGVVPVGDSPGP